MWINRDIANRIADDNTAYIQVVLGPRQCGKSSLLSFISQRKFSEITLDDLQVRTLANQDPALLFAQHQPPLIIDEAQYAPNLFPELKRIVDDYKKKELFSGNAKHIQKPLFRLTGSSQVSIDKKVKESLVGRASYYYLNTLSVNELCQAFPNIPIDRVMYKGGWPELYTHPEISVKQYLNDYIRSYIEKDIILSLGITKQAEFNIVLGLLAARVAEFVNYSSLANGCDIKSVTVREWVSILERTNLVYLLQPYATNLNKRLIKSPKIYFLDTGLAVRLQGWNELEPFMRSPQAGHVFENLVLNEIVKFKNNFGKDWNVWLWRTKDGEEIDFIIENARGDILALDAKMSIQATKPVKIPKSFHKVFPKVTQIILVTFGGNRMQLSNECLQLPIYQLKDLLETF